MHRSWWTGVGLRALRLSVAMVACGIALPCAIVPAEEVAFKTPHAGPVDIASDASLAARLTVLTGEVLPAGITSATPILNPIKAGTTVIGSDELDLLRMYLERPTHLTNWRDVGERFRIHYDGAGPEAPLPLTGDSYVDVAAAACRHAAQVYHGPGQKWPQPKRDIGGGNDRIDIYIADLGPGVYGYCLHEELPAERGTTGFMVVDNDFAGLPVADIGDAIRLTIAHEYHHLIQFGYGYDPEAAWFMEQLATMEEGIAYPHLRHRETYLPVFLTQPHRPLDFGNGPHEYGSWIWPEYLQRAYGWDVIRSAWEIWRDDVVPMIEALDVSLRRRGSSLDEAYLEWAVWNGCLGYAAPAEQYGNAIVAEARMHSEAVMDRYPSVEWRPALTRQPERLGANYIDLQRQSGFADNNLKIVLTGCESLAGVRLLIWNQDHSFDQVMVPTHVDDQYEFLVEDWERVSFARLVVANGSSAEYSCNFSVSVHTKFVADIGDDDVVTSRMALHCAPNPFEPYTVLRFELPETREVSLRIFDAQGRQVISLLEGRASGDRHAVYWAGLDEAGQQVPAGMYYGQLALGDVTRRIKLIRMH